jgi:proteasome lid subunit RPN8/RPN11
VVGWYHTGPRLREADIDINQLMARYCDNPLLLICEVQVGRWRWTAAEARVGGGAARSGWEWLRGRAEATGM